VCRRAIMKLMLDCNVNERDYEMLYAPPILRPAAVISSDTARHMYSISVHRQAFCSFETFTAYCLHFEYGMSNHHEADPYSFILALAQGPTCTPQRAPLNKAVVCLTGFWLLRKPLFGHFVVHIQHVVGRCSALSASLSVIISNVHPPKIKG
jgi:hypothetical protein